MGKKEDADSEEIKKMKQKDVKLTDKLSAKGDMETQAALKEKLSVEKEKVPQLEEMAKTEKNKAALLDTQLADSKEETVKAKGALTTLKAQMSGGSAQLISKIEFLQKQTSSLKEELAHYKAQLAQKTTQKASCDKKLERKTVKSRTLGASVYKLEQELTTTKQDLANMHKQHERLKFQYADAKAKRELAEGRLKDSAERHLACKESMRRMKQYSQDTINEQAAKIQSLTSSVSLEKEKLRAVEVSRAEAKKTKQIAEK